MKTHEANLFQNRINMIFFVFMYNTSNDNTKQRGNHFQKMQEIFGMTSRTIFPLTHFHEIHFTCYIIIILDIFLFNIVSYMAGLFLQLVCRFFLENKSH